MANFVTSHAYVSSASLLQGARYALRTLTKSPAFCLVAVASLALGSGASSAIFSRMTPDVTLQPRPVYS